MHPVRNLLSTIFLVAGGTAQVTHFVGPGGSIGQVLASAAPGDVVLISPGTYGPFQAFVGVTIRGAAPGAVFVQGQCQIGCPLNQTLHLVDLHLEPLIVSGGCCTLDSCVIVPSITGPTLFATGATVHLQECSIGAPIMAWGIAPALRAVSCVVTANDTTFRGADANPQIGSSGSHAIDLGNGSVFHGSYLTVNGGNGFAGFQPPGHALRADSGSTVWISDSVLTGGLATNVVGSPPWVCAVVATAGRLSRCTLAPTCTPGVPSTGPMLGAHRVGIPVAGAPLAVDFTTDPFGLIGVFAGLSLGSPLLAIVEQPIALDPAGAIPLALLVAGGTGVASGVWNLPPGVANATLWLQGVAGGSFPLAVSPVAGGVIR